MKLRSFLSIVLLLCCSFTIGLAQNFWEQTGGPASNVGIEAFGKGNDGYVYTATKTLDMAERVHDCIGRLLADFMLESAKPDEPHAEGGR